jgi:hypothetical protein
MKRSTITVLAYAGFGLALLAAALLVVLTA